MEAEKLYDLAKREAKKKTPNYEKTAGLLEKAHVKGEVKATCALADWYMRGVFFKKNRKRGLQYYRTAAKGLNVDAMFNLGVFYENGCNLKKNEKRAFEYYLAAAVQGKGGSGKWALLEVMRCFFHGIGIEKNKRLAIMLRSICDRYGVDFDDDRYDD
ncbi:MAG: sel1 repeat family protein [Betaproteobacteria bacterium]|nr:sel1 repeat family protein [Betaproteobacteria bacterium]